MQRLVQYRQSVFQLYNSYLWVLVFCINKLSPSTLIAKFQRVQSTPWMYSIKFCNFWAKSCYFVSKSTRSNGEPITSITPLLALSMFLLEQSSTLYGHSHPNDPTITILYGLAQEFIEDKAKEELGLTDIANLIFYNNEKMLHKVEDSLWCI